MSKVKSLTVSLVALATIAMTLATPSPIMRGSHAQSPTWPLSKTHPNSECPPWSGTQCATCVFPVPPGGATEACTRPDPAAGWTYPGCYTHSGAMGKTCTGTFFSCGPAVNCVIGGGSTSLVCYNGGWCL